MEDMAGAEKPSKKRSLSDDDDDNDDVCSAKKEKTSEQGQKWATLVHNGVIFPPPYKPHGVEMLYNGQPVSLTPEQEEVATMFAVMKDTEYATKPKFIDNFMNDWRLILGKKHVIKKFELCDFTPIYEWHQMEKEKKKQMTAEEKKLIKEERMKPEEKYIWAVVDGVKKEGDDLFDKLDTRKLNAHLKELMPGLTAKVFRTYNASMTLDIMLNKESKSRDFAEKKLDYQHANKEVAIICNHQRSVQKAHPAQMSRLSQKMAELEGLLDGIKMDLKRAKKGKPSTKDADGKPQKKKMAPEMLERKIGQTNTKIEKLKCEMKTREDLKDVALGTSKINYLDPRISVAWCKRREVPIEKIFNKSLLEKFAWAMDVDPHYRF